MSDAAQGESPPAESDQDDSQPSEESGLSPETVKSAVKEAFAAPPERFLKRESPLAARVMRIVNAIFALLFSVPLTYILFDIAAAIVIAWVVTSEARNAVDSSWVSGALLLVSLYVVMHLGYLVAKSGVLAWLLDGSPTFSDLGGVRRSLLHATMRTVRQIRFTFDPPDAKIANYLADLDLDISENALKARYVEVARARDPDATDDEIEQRWQGIWRNEILAYQVGDVTFRDIFGPPAYASNIVLFRLAAVRNLVAPAFKIFQVVLIVLVYRALNGDTSVLTVIQVGVVLGFALSMLIYLNHSKALAQIEVLPPSPELPADVQERQRQVAGRVLIPLRVALASSYFGAIGRYFARQIFVGALYNALIIIILIAISVGTALVFADSRAELPSWYGKLALALAVAIPAGMLAAHYVATLLVERVRHLAAIVVGGLVTSLLPIGIDYLVTGELARLDTTLVSSVIAGVAGAFAAVFGTQLTNRVSGAPAPVEAQPSS